MRLERPGAAGERTRARSGWAKGLGAVGPSSNFAVLTDFQVWVCTLAMLLGRLEFLSVMALLAPSFWRR